MIPTPKSVRGHYPRGLEIIGWLLDNTCDLGWNGKIEVRIRQKSLKRY